MQNFRTRSVSLNQRWYDVAIGIPAEASSSRGFLASEYRVVDVGLSDGRRLEGVLLVRDDLLVPEAEPAFASEEIVTLEATPSDRWPDFTITDRDALLDRGGRSIEHGNLIRLELFGPPRPKTDWRALPIEEAHEEALDVDRKIATYDGEIPACYHGPRDLVLVPSGVQLTVYRADTETTETLTLRPRSAALWRDLLRMGVTIDPAFTLGHLLALLDLPAEVAREIYHRCCTWEGDGFAEWIEAARAPNPFAGDDDPVQEIVVYPTAHLEDDADTYHLGFDASGLGRPATAPDEELGTDIGFRQPFSLGHGGPASLRDAVLRYNPEFVLEETHDALMAYFRGPHRAWSVAGREGPEPRMPVRFRGKRSIRFGEFIGAIFDELTPVNADPDRRNDGAHDEADLCDYCQEPRNGEGPIFPEAGERYCCVECHADATHDDDDEDEDEDEA